MEFSSCSPVHRISCIYSQLAHLSQLRWVGGFSPSGCICWKTLSRRMLDAFEFHTTTSQSHLIWNPSTFKTQLDGLARFGLVTCNYLQIFQLHPSQRSFSQVISCFPNHRNQTPTLTHQLTSRRDKKNPSTDPVSCQKTGQNRAQQTTKLHQLDMFHEENSQKILPNSVHESIPIEPRQPGCSCNTPPVPWLCGVFVGPFGYEWLVDFRENVLQIDGKRPERNDMEDVATTALVERSFTITWAPKMPFQQHASTCHVPSIFF